MRKAKKNLRYGYSFVGITDNMTTSFRILKLMFPDFFGDENIPVDICNKCGKKSVPSSGAVRTRDSSQSQIKDSRLSPSNRRVIESLNSNDMELYDFAQKLFLKRATVCEGRWREHERHIDMQMQV